MKYALASRTPVIVPTTVLSEWWRSGGRAHERALEILKPVIQIEVLTERVAKVASNALAWYSTTLKTTDATERERLTALVTIDATVLATACLLGRKTSTTPVTVYTGDMKDMQALANFKEFPGVVLLPPD